MKNLPEIDPEVRGLLEEIVADPRSSIRLVPRKPLKSWFDSGETVSAREVSGTKAERHLIEAHREALAQLLYEAAMIAFWKGENPYCHRPIGVDGTVYDENKAEARWRPRATRVLQHSGSEPSIAELLRQCTEGIASTRAKALAQASLSLVPSDKARWYVAAISFQGDSPRTAIRLLSETARHPNTPSLRGDILSGLAASLCLVGRFLEAREAYRAASAACPAGLLDRLYVFNLSCFLGDREGARTEAMDLGKLVQPGDARLIEAVKVIRRWARNVRPIELDHARSLARSISEKSSPSILVLCHALTS